MIKLKSILKKEAISSVSLTSEQELAQIDSMISAARSMGENNPPLWRGIRAPKASLSILHVVNDRDSWRGANIGAREIMKYLGIQNPIFTYNYFSRVIGLFGRPHIVILKQPYKLFQSPTVDDAMAYAEPTIYKTTKSHGGELRSQIGTRSEKEQAAKALEGAKTYVQLSNTKDTKSRHEIIADAKEYWAIDITHVIHNGGKFMTHFDKIKPSKGFYTDPEEYIETYGEIVEVLEKYKKYLLWQIRRRGI